MEIGKNWIELSWGGMTINEKIARLENNVEYLKGIVPDGLKDTLTDLESKIETIRLEIETINKNVADTNAKITEIIGDIDKLSDLSNRVDKIANDLTATRNLITANTKNIGDLTTLATNTHSDLVSAINEIDWIANNPTDKRVGDLTALTTTAKDNLVNAINEVNAKSSSIEWKEADSTSWKATGKGLLTDISRHSTIINFGLYVVEDISYYASKIITGTILDESGGGLTEIFRIRDAGGMVIYNIFAYYDHDTSNVVLCDENNADISGDIAGSLFAQYI